LVFTGFWILARLQRELVSGVASFLLSGITLLREASSLIHLLKRIPSKGASQRIFPEAGTIFSMGFSSAPGSSERSGCKSRFFEEQC
jgi:hypothetical protein